MWIKIKLGKDWWLLPSDREFSKRDLLHFHDVPYIAPLEAGETVKFFNIKKKKVVKQILAIIALNYSEGYKPYLKDGSIVFKKIKQSS